MSGKNAVNRWMYDRVGVTDNWLNAKVKDSVRVDKKQQAPYEICTMR
jgi:hypothetical protein